VTGSTPPWKRRSPEPGADQGPSRGPHGARDDERGPSRTTPGATGSTGPAPLEPADGRADLPAVARPSAPVAGTEAPPPGQDRKRGRAAAVRDKARQGVRKGGSAARAGLAYLADRIIDMAPRVPVRDLATLRRHFPGLGPEQLADKLVAGAAAATSTVGAGIGAAAMLPVPPAMPTELAAEITGVAAIELKLIAELHEVYGVRPPGTLKQRSTAYLNSWSGERKIDVTKPSTVSTALNSRMKQQLRQQIMKRMVRDLPNLMPFMVGAAVGALMNRRDTRKLAERIRKELRTVQVPWDALPELPPLQPPADPLELEDGSQG
jgi:hypothetical protein